MGKNLKKLNIKVIDQSNSGVSRARNNGIKEAQGGIYFVLRFR